ncbi:SCO4848 family membrane protein [Microbacterium sp. NPDC056234]|uniref:SCO4848 family membrane protein n=1 Tax=Microbacterium sp. NPDC056234 TaxID=3345757 RepID=UPI0035E22446
MIPLAILLFLNAAFNVVVWPRFYKRVAQDPRARDAEGRPTTFLKVHVVLIAIALVLALVSALAGVAALVGAL